ncbi:MAG TPA: glutamine synthetase, partial [bacterium]|nr:glutamine synthetase [bacterium]
MQSPFTVEWLREQIQEGKIDTVLVAFPDQFGRLLGKRCTGSYFLDQVLSSGIDLCSYLLAADLEMNPLPGFEMTSWEKGYGDFHGVPDLATLRPLHWLNGTALVLADLTWETGAPVTQSPRAILKNQLERVRERGLFPRMGSELEFYLFIESEEELGAPPRQYRNPTPSTHGLIDYHILSTTRDEGVIREIRNRMDSS